MKDIKDALLYLKRFDENYMFHIEHNKKIFCVSEVLRCVKIEDLQNMI